MKKKKIFLALIFVILASLGYKTIQIFDSAKSYSAKIYNKDIDQKIEEFDKEEQEILNEIKDNYMEGVYYYEVYDKNGNLFIKNIKAIDEEKRISIDWSSINNVVLINKADKQSSINLTDKTYFQRNIKRPFQFYLYDIINGENENDKKYSNGYIIEFLNPKYAKISKEDGIKKIEGKKGSYMIFDDNNDLKEQKSVSSQGIFVSKLVKKEKNVDGLLKMYEDKIKDCKLEESIEAVKNYK